MVQSNYTEFFLTIATIIANEHKDALLRISAASIFKRLITFKVPNPPLRRMTSSFGTKSIQ